MQDLRSSLHAALGDTYALGPELGGGGMARVFVAEERALGRRVVVKVLPPELAASVNAERFRREIQVAAQLQHPHVVPVLSAGEIAGVPYFTMPFVDGESLRERLARDGALPIPEAVEILRDVAKALAFAHRRGVIHRDIKPGNILLWDRHALVADFGVAKAISASAQDSGGHGLTSIGIALGTPAYMAPEQVAADPAVDHRADIYAFGVVAYEMLAGRTPFDGTRTPQQVLSAHIAERPEPITGLRDRIPTALSTLVMRCLAKDPARRPETAVELLQVLEGLTFPSGETAPGVARPARSALALASYGAAALAVAGVAWVAVRTLDVPDWVLPGALLLALLGLPVVALTALVQRTTDVSHGEGTGVLARTTGALVAAVPRRWFTWRRTAWLGASAMALFVAITVGYVALRALGVGPAGTLLAAGTIGEREPVLVTDFNGPPNDTLLGGVVSEAFRTDLGQSHTVTVVQPTAVRAALARMRRAAGTRVDLALAREIAVREGIKVILDGDVSRAGNGYILSARLVAADSGSVLVAMRETADDPREVIPAIDRLSKRIRAKVGESLRSVRAAPPLEQVSTTSLEALRKYTQSLRAIEEEGNYPKAQALLEEAIALDTSFAMAHRKLGAVLSNFTNVGASPERASEAVRKAFEHRDRLTEVERQLTVAAYYADEAHYDPARVVAAYEAVLAAEPNNAIALNNLGQQYFKSGDYATALAYAERVLAADSLMTTAHINVVTYRLLLGDTAGALGAMDDAARRHPDNSSVAVIRLGTLFVVGRYDSAASLARRALADRRADPTIRLRAVQLLGFVAQVHGRLAEAEEFMRQAAHSGVELSPEEAVYTEGVVRAQNDIVLRGARSKGVRRLESVLAQHPLSAIPPWARPYENLAWLFAEGGRPDRARALLAAMEAELPAHMLRLRAAELHSMRGRIALAEGRAQDAVGELRRSVGAHCLTCALPLLARAYEAAGQPDSAVSVLERYLATPEFGRIFNDGLSLAWTYQSLGRLYDARGRRDTAAAYYRKFVELWKGADPELQPRVREAERRLTQLSAGAPVSGARYSGRLSGTAALGPDSR